MITGTLWRKETSKAESFSFSNLDFSFVSNISFVISKTMHVKANLFVGLTTFEWIKQNLVSPRIQMFDVMASFFQEGYPYLQGPLTLEVKIKLKQVIIWSVG